MKVLLYENGRGGHRRTILRYVEKSLKRRGIDYSACDDGGEEGVGLEKLEATADERGCDMVHILTSDGKGRRWLIESLWRKRSQRRIPLVGTYYLYSNCYKMVGGLLWDYVHYRSRVERLLISDDFLAVRRVPRWRRRYLSYLPDPWDPDEFPALTKSEAQHSIGLRPERIRFLVFGDLSWRKGISLVLEAFSRLKEPTAELVLAGVWSKDFGGSPEERAIRDLVGSGRAQLLDGYVDEKDVSPLFHASDFVLCAYQAFFAVSSNSLTRACAAGRPVIAAEHGVVGRLVREQGLGIVYPTGDAAGLTAAMERGCEWVKSGRSPYRADRAAQVAAARTLDVFGDRLATIYREVLEATSGKVVAE